MCSPQARAHSHSHVHTHACTRIHTLVHSTRNMYAHMHSYTDAYTKRTHALDMCMHVFILDVCMCTHRRTPHVMFMCTHIHIHARIHNANTYTHCALASVSILDATYTRIRRPFPACRVFRGTPSQIVKRTSDTLHKSSKLVCTRFEPFHSARAFFCG